LLQPQDNSVTRLSLLARLREDDRDSEAWATFIDRYGSRIYEWCLARRLQPADAEDVTQNVLLKLAKHLGSFEYDPQLTFRGWLRRVAENTIIDFLRQTARVTSADAIGSELGRPTQPAAQRLIHNNELLNEATAREDLLERLDAAFDLELLDLAKERVKLRIEARRWEAWERLALQQQSGEEVAVALDMKIATVYSSRFQVQKMIAEEIRLLEGNEE
jgi:RNA polymerase sigma factor (sigma-70 family)